ncbi:hypothetical protein B0H15DRAFT_499260 [Mycena belliarum]|uniref:Transmembrane protein n=1 Tax=Mycena belliarum TaxID=1033014 RepID=A0AAD6TVD3_9AGAR|nr:hypothetical protein B0H15DRAFT_499260 [Mycena belliae]
MTSRNFTIDNVNPLIQYAPAAAWSEGSRTGGDPLASSYSNNGTFTLCTTQGSSATFSFNGTQVYVFGARRANHGPYTVTLDGASATFDGFSAAPLFGTLFVSKVMPQGIHTVTVTNALTDTTKPFLDIDFITWTSKVTGDGKIETVEDTEAQFTYQPSTSWSTDLSSNLLTGFSGNNGHVTLTTGASALISFTGDFITVFGAVGPNIAPYTVKVDGAIGATFNATKRDYTPQVALYHADGLGSGNHTLELISQPAVAGQLLAVDFVQVAPAAATPTGSGSRGGSDAGAASGGGKTTKSSIGPAIGGAVAGIAALVIIGLIAFFCLRRKRRREQENDYIAPYPGAPVAAPASYTMNSINNGNMPASSMSMYSTTSQAQLVPQRYHDTSPPPIPVPFPPHTQSDAGSHPYYHNNTRSVSGHDRDDAASSSGRASSVFSSGAAGLGARGPSISRSGKGAPLPLPPTANMPLPTGTSRMHVPGREQDFGPLPNSPLPPDYSQATESYNPRSSLAYNRSESAYTSAS